MVDTLLLNNDSVIGFKRSFINVSKSGLGEKVYLFATENGLLYGIFCCFDSNAFWFFSK